MGGFGSGDWHRFGSKSTVEQSLDVSIEHFRGRLHHGGGRFVDLDLDERQRAFHRLFCHLQQRPASRHAALPPGRKRRRRDSDSFADHADAIRRRAVVVYLPAGYQWGTCNRRAGKLYLPPRRRYLGADVPRFDVQELSRGEGDEKKGNGSS